MIHIHKREGRGRQMERKKDENSVYNDRNA